MITIKKLRWGNLFSYGDNNELDFSANPLTQIVGYNGHGKSSIALVLEEVLYNKNSKGIKKADILNRNSKHKSYYIELEFEKDGDKYEIKTSRGSTQSVKLLKNGKDISSHTATGTYKTIEEIIGYDHKTFAQIVYQSSASSLEFLTATDSNRKKFLIDLLNLNKYVEAGDVFKAAVKETTEQQLVLSTKIASIENWLEKYTKISLVQKPIGEVPEAPREQIEEVANITENIKNISSTNRKIIQNNKYKEVLDSIVFNPSIKPPNSSIDINAFKASKIEQSKTIKDCDIFIQKIQKLGKHCPTCMQTIETAVIDDLVKNQLLIKKATEDNVVYINKQIEEYEKVESAFKKEQEKIKLYEEYHSFYDPSLQQELLDEEELQKRIKVLEAEISKINKQIKDITAANSEATVHNTKIEVIKTQIKEQQEELVLLKEELNAVSNRLNILQILVKTFSSTGLVAYKIECLIKDLEEVTNKYLADLSGGRFQIGFKISSSDKLNVVITDNGKDIDISALSNGECARVNTAALLGIRKLMQSLSNSRINLLILDETIENLDVDGKEKLVEVLLSEEYLNTFIISHGFTHPLLEKIHVVKNNNISRIENV